MDIPVICVDLDLPPRQRFLELERFAEPCRRMIDSYVGELQGTGAIQQVIDLLPDYLRTYVDDERVEEMAGVADVVGVPTERIAMANLYYDALKLVWGCTAFAVDTPSGPLHGRNLDWWTENNQLAKHTIIYELVRSGAVLCRVIGWPGFIGALSGTAPGRFSITLNTVSSREPVKLGRAMTLLIRDVLENAPDYNAAVERLKNTDVLSDSLLLISGIEPGQMCVIERTPTRGVVRGPEHGAVVVTNDYKSIDPETPLDEDSALQQTSCGRFDRARELLGARDAFDVENAFAVLTDPHVQMAITVQHMVMRAATDTLIVRLPA